MLSTALGDPQGISQPQTPPPLPPPPVAPPGGDAPPPPPPPPPPTPPPPGGQPPPPGQPPPFTPPPGFPPGWVAPGTTNQYGTKTRPTAPPPGQLPNSGTWQWNATYGAFVWVSYDLDPGQGGSGGQNRGTPTGTNGTPGGGGITFPGGGYNDNGSGGLTPPGWAGYPMGQVPTWYDPAGGFDPSKVVGGFTPPSTDFGSGMQGVDMTQPGAAELYFAQNAGNFGQAGSQLNDVYQRMMSAYGNGVFTPTVGRLAPMQFGNLAPLQGFGALPTMGDGAGEFLPPPQVDYRPAPGFGQLPGTQYGNLANRFTNPQVPGAFSGQFGAYEGPKGGPTGQFSGMGSIGNVPGSEFGPAPNVGYTPSTTAFGQQYNPGNKPGERFLNEPGLGATPGDFFAKDTAAANMDPYYQNEARKASERIRTEMSAKGMYGSSATDDQISEMMTNLAAQQAKEEAQYGLQRSAESRAWEEARTGYGLERSQDVMQRSQNRLAWEQAGANYGLSRSEDELNRSQNALSWEQAKSSHDLNLSEDALNRARLGLDYTAQRANYGLELSQDAMARNAQALDWQQAQKNYEMDVANYGVDIANQRLAYQQQASSFGLDAYSQNLARSAQLQNYEQMGANYDLSRADYGINLMAQQLAGQQAARNYDLNVSQDAIARGQLDLGYTQALGQYELGRGSQNIDRYNAALSGQQAAANYGLNSYNAQLAYLQAQRNYDLANSQDALARAQYQQHGQEINLGYANMLGQLAQGVGSLQAQGLNTGMAAANLAQQAQMQRGQNAINNALGYGGALSTTMGQNYNPMLQMDAALFNQMHQIFLGQGAEGLSQALTQFGLTQSQIDQFMGMFGGTSKVLTGAGLGGTGTGTPFQNGNTGITGGGQPGGTPPIISQPTSFAPGAPGQTFVGWSTSRDPATGQQVTVPVYE